jgi:hypothetical protein
LFTSTSTLPVGDIGPQADPLPSRCCDHGDRVVQLDFIHVNADHIRAARRCLAGHKAPKATARTRDDDNFIFDIAHMCIHFQ